MTAAKVKIKEALTAPCAPSCQNTVSTGQGDFVALKNKTGMRTLKQRDFVACTVFFVFMW